MRSFKIARRVSCGVVAMVATLGLSLGLEPPAGLLDGLGAEAYPERMAAEKSLQAWAENGGEAAKEWLLIQHRKSSNPEVRRGSLAVLKSVVITDLISQRPGFVGIRMADVKLPDESGMKGYGIEIQAVNSGTPAEKAGLRVTDVIVKLDGEGWIKPDAPNDFAGRIGRLRGGDKIRLELLRGGEIEVIELVLAPRPWSAGIYNEQLQLRGDPFVDLNHLPQNEEQAENAAFQEWMRGHPAEIPER